jgi:hypothetical protein
VVTLDVRSLNRATLARQLLLDRASLPALDAIERLAGMQAQAPLSPYAGLWTRLHSFRPDELAGLLLGRQAVRTHLMRTTVHLVSARDVLWLWPLTHPVHERGFATGSPFGRRLAGVDLDDLVKAGRELLAGQPLTRTELGRALAASWPGYDPADLAYGVSYLAAVLQVPPRGVWGQPQGKVAVAPIETWLGRPFDPAPSAAELIRRYLAAFGPATVNDIQAWSGLTRLREVVAGMAGELWTARDENGAELFDLPDAPRPGPDRPAPVRFLPEYDNLLLSHADRSRVNPAGRPVPLPAGNGSRAGTILIDGVWDGTWSVHRSAGGATLRIETYSPAPAGELEAEGAELLRFLAADAGPQRVEIRPGGLSLGRVPAQVTQEPVAGTGLAGHGDRIREQPRPVGSGDQQRRDPQHVLGQLLGNRPRRPAGAPDVPAVYGHIDGPGAGHDAGRDRVAADQHQVVAGDGQRPEQVAGAAPQHPGQVLRRVVGAGALHRPAGPGDTTAAGPDLSQVHRLLQRGQRVGHVHEQRGQVPLGAWGRAGQRFGPHAVELAEGVADRAFQQGGPAGQCGRGLRLGHDPAGMTSGKPNQRNRVVSKNNTTWSRSGPGVAGSARPVRCSTWS